MKDLTPKQMAVLRFIFQFSKENRYPPSIREIVKHLGVKSTNGVNDHLVALAKKQCITRCKEKQTSRSVVITPMGMEKLGIVTDDSLARPTLRIPLVFEIVPEGDLFSPTNVEDVISVDSGLFPSDFSSEKSEAVTGSMLSKSNLFALRFHGDNMNGVGIRNEDILLARKQDTANSGDVTILSLAGDTLIRRYFPEGERVRLQTTGEASGSVSYANASDIKIVGVVTGLIRTAIPF